MQDRLDVTDVKKETSPQKFSIMTFNIACLPFLGSINAKFLRLNHDRVKLIIEKLIKWNNNNKKNIPGSIQVPDVICFQEAMAVETRLTLKKALSEDKDAPYPYNTGSLGTHLRGSGLYIFSKYPILESTFIPFNNEKIGDETLALKGVIGVKLKLNDQAFVTIFNTHLEAGGAILEDKQKKQTGKSNSYERGEQMGLIANLFKTWGVNAPEAHPLMKHHKTFFCGDFNTTLNDERRMHSLSTGKAKNGFKKGMIKYPGQYELFSNVEHTVPKNFSEVRDDEHYDKNSKKEIVPELLETAKKQNHFIGTTIAAKSCKENKEFFKVIQPYDAQPQVIDGVFCSYLSDKQQSEWNILDAPGGFETRIVSFDFEIDSAPSPVALSDHFPVQSFWTPTLFLKQPVIDKPKKEAVEPSGGYCIVM